MPKKICQLLRVKTLRTWTRLLNHQNAANRNEPRRVMVTKRCPVLALVLKTMVLKTMKMKAIPMRKAKTMVIMLLLNNKSREDIVPEPTLSTNSRLS